MSKYCNFSRIKFNSRSAKYILHPFYDDQCGLHRTCQACGSCKNGYTLPFDLHDCININSCSPGITSNSDVCNHLLDTCHSNNTMADVLSNQCWLLVWNHLLLQCCRYSVGTSPKLFQ